MARLPEGRPGAGAPAAGLHPLAGRVDGACRATSSKCTASRWARAQGAPGTVLSTEAGLDVACGEGSLRILEVQPEGRRRMGVKDFLLGHRLVPGSRPFGPSPQVGPAMNVLVLHGPNLDLLGRRPGDDPSLSLPALDRRIAERARRLGLSVRALQTNHEGALLDALRNPGGWADAVVLSPGRLALTSQVLHEAVAQCGLKVVEVHLEDASGKASVRRHSLLQDVCVARVVGEGPDGYLRALERLVALGGSPPAARPKDVQKQSLGRAVRPPVPRACAAAGGQAGARGAQAHGEDARPPRPRLPPRHGRGPGLSLGARDGHGLSRAKVRARIAERLSGRLTPAGLSTWARAEWLELQRGAPAESGQRELLEETLQQLLLGLEKPSRLTEEQLVELMAALDG